MTTLLYPQLIDICKIDLPAGTATIEVETMTLMPSSGERLGGGDRFKVTVPLVKILTRHEKKDLNRMRQIWRKGDKLEFMARYRFTGLEAAIEDFYRSVLANLRMIRPTSQTGSRIEHLRPAHYAVLAELAKERQARAELNNNISSVLVFPTAAAGLRQEKAVAS